MSGFQHTGNHYMDGDRDIVKGRPFTCSRSLKISDQIPTGLSIDSCPRSIAFSLFKP